MPERLRECHVGLSVCRADAGVSLTASMPTKIAEFLATGRPVIVNPGLGDADKLIEATGTGIVLRDGSAADLEETWDRLEDMLADPGTSERCRALAEQHFNLDQAVDRLLDVYARAVSGRPAARPL
jgi:glycosyltransferase involved in cell wall biosynthesis